MPVTSSTPRLIGTSMLVRPCRSAASAEAKERLPGIGDRRQGDQRRDPDAADRASPAPCCPAGPRRRRPRCRSTSASRCPRRTRPPPAPGSARGRCRPAPPPARPDRTAPGDSPALRSADQMLGLGRPAPRQTRRSRRVVMLTRPVSTDGSRPSTDSISQTQAPHCRPSIASTSSLRAVGAVGDEAGEVVAVGWFRPRRAARRCNVRNTARGPAPGSSRTPPRIRGSRTAGRARRAVRNGRRRRGTLQRYARGRGASRGSGCAAHGASSASAAHRTIEPARRADISCRGRTGRRKLPVVPIVALCSPGLTSPLVPASAATLGERNGRAVSRSPDGVVRAVSGLDSPHRRIASGRRTRSVSTQHRMAACIHPGAHAQPSAASCFTRRSTAL